MSGRIVGIVLGCLWLSGAAAAETMRITHNHVFPPFAEVRDGTSVGLGVDIIRAAAARAGIDVVFVPLTIEQQMPALRDGRADATFSGVSPERRETLDFSDAVVTTGGALYVRAPEATPEKSPRRCRARSSSPRGRARSRRSSERTHRR